jgi:hypothetical protein
MAAAKFMNSNSLPIALMQSLVVSVPDLAWGSTDNTDALRICNRITLPPLNYETTCLSVSQILVSHNLDRVVVVAHSFGTAVTSYMLQDPTLSQQVIATLVDPITFLLHHPSVAYNFLY